MVNDETLRSLEAAYAASPDNVKLCLVLALAHAERGERAEAAALVAQASWDEAPLEDRLSAAAILLAGDRYEDALRLAGEDEPRALLVQARARFGLGQNERARSAYQRAVAANPTLEDPALAERLETRTRVIPSAEGRPRLRVISNDDTVAAEADRLLVPEPESIDFSGVGGLDDIKKQIHRKIILPFQKPSLFERFRKRVGGGILLYGPPGCGKTLLARATAGECSATFFNVAISDVLDMYIGESEQKLHALFEKARNSVPAVLFFDELEALGGKRQYNREAVSSKLVSQFLSEMDGFTRNNKGVLILGATNVPWAVDSAFRRPGRFDRVLFVPPPDRPARRRILEILLDRRPIADDIDLDDLAERSSGFSGADLENVVETAADLAIERSISSGAESPIGSRQLREALAELRPTTVEWLTTARNYARYANESGHYDEVLAFLARHGKS
ncbi:MAG TPA: ATP-binding protein [Candidatus Polarisedimenticolaceae bacterium]|nr:ATP-binding protein [Candidatus Polarisedimenticolaceae bacterium]